MGQNIIISQVPETEPVLEGDKMSPVWQRWLNLFQLFINQYFPPFMIQDVNMGNTPRILFAPPLMSQAERDALFDLPVTGLGLIIFNTDTNKINYYQNGVWAALP